MVDDIRANPQNPDQDQPGEDGIDRRGFLECMAWVGTGVLWTVSGGILSSRTLAHAAAGEPTRGDFSFAQISDSHIGFAAEPNKDVTATLQLAINKLNALQPAPEFILHTGDLSHSQKAGAFDTLAENLKSLKTRQVFYVPGEHDVFADGGKEYLNRYGAGTKGSGWQSFDYRGVHFVGLVNVLTFKESHLGSLGSEQLEWLKQDLAGLPASTPIVVFAHVPLWAVYPQWGWATGDGEQALSLLRRFGSVTVLNGHIHQAMQKIEGNVAFHSAMSTAFPQPPPGGAPSPGPWKQVTQDRVKTLLGLRQINYVEGKGSLAVIDSTLA
jgi:3',5'-cyclic AMP phosphodiesterase CpdA